MLKVKRREVGGGGGGMEGRGWGVQKTDRLSVRIRELRGLRRARSCHDKADVHAVIMDAYGPL